MARNARNKPAKKAAAPKRNRGRPSPFQAAYCGQAEKLCRLGATDEDIADFFGVHVDTIDAWKRRHREFSESLKRGKRVADMEVADRLYQKAIGYEHQAEKIFCNEATGGEIVRAAYTERYPPDTTAAIFWLKNRQSKKWRDKQEVEHGGSAAFLAAWQTIAAGAKKSEGRG